MELVIEPELWHELSTWGLQVPEAGDPRRRARDLWGAEAGREDSGQEDAAAACAIFSSDAFDYESGALAGQGAGQQGAHSSPAAPAGVCRGIDRRHASELSYSAFVRDYMAPNVPVVIEGAADRWRARQEWVRAEDGSLDLDSLEMNFGAARVKATDTARVHEGCGPSWDMTLAEFIAWWREHRAAAQAGPRGSEGGGVEGSGNGELLYVKDWHFTRDFPQYQAYTCPVYFRDDWLNEWYDARGEHIRAAAQHAQQAQQLEGEGPEQRAGPAPGPQQADPGLGGREPAAAVAGAAVAEGAAGDRGEMGPAREGPGQGGAAGQRGEGCKEPGRGGEFSSWGGPGDDVASDYRFVYLGPQGTWTPLHSDVLRSHSWSANVAGRKRWRLLAPAHTHLLYDKLGQTMAPDFWLLPGDEGQGYMRELEADMFPGLAQARALMLEFTQEPGEAVFVPSGWHHSVENLEDTLSINHNWINGHNVHWTWHLVCREYEEAKEMIEDCRVITSPPEFESLVQRNLGANCGIDFASLGEFLRCIARHSTAHLGCCPELRACRATAAQQEQGDVGGVEGGTACKASCRDSSGERMGELCQRPTIAASCAGSSSPCGIMPCSSLPPCCAHHALRLRRVGQVLQPLLAAEERIMESCSTACTARAAAGAQQAESNLEECLAEEGIQHMCHEGEVVANRACLEAMRGVLSGAGLGRLAAWSTAAG